LVVGSSLNRPTKIILWDAARMNNGVHDARDHTASGVASLRSDARVPDARTARWLSGMRLRAEVDLRAADAGLAAELDTLSGQTLDELR